ncbi:MAG: hypothetical protein AUI14_26590 [Actinobacteria bacterium 13_2_20CM_2_71_6]|nr:MAG: hypothetical protein AUI14_26590 [Actinobacteria bacterium 13_2_20CM_2_71_6]
MARPVSRRHLNTLVAFAFGAVFVLVGLAGFVVSSGHHAIGQDGGKLLGLFQVNVVHNLVHVAVGAVMIGAAIAGARAAKAVNLLFGVVYLVVFVFGLFAVGNSLNFLALNGADNGLHLVLGTVLTVIGLLSDRES